VPSQYIVNNNRPITA